MITLALPKDEFFDKNLDLIKKTGADVSAVEPTSVVVTDKDGLFSYIVCDEDDVASFVEMGIADLGIADKASLLENGKNVKELLDLKTGEDKLCIIGAKTKSANVKETLNVATSYPKIAEEVFQMRQIKISTIKLGFGKELAFLWGYADLLLCKMRDVKFLNPESIAIYEFVGATSYRLIANKLSLNLKTDELYAFVEKLKANRIPPK